MNNMEIEKKFIPKYLPEEIKNAVCHEIEQAYLNTAPVIRIRKSDDDYYLTYKGGGKMVRKEYNLPLNKESYYHLLEKADGNIITKKRFEIPLSCGLVAELDVFEGKFEGLVLVEVEFESVEAANEFVAPEWFGEDVTSDGRYHNSYLSMVK